MKDILECIVADKYKELVDEKRLLPASRLYPQVERLVDAERAMRAQNILEHPGDGTPTTRFSMRDALACSVSGVIAEFKRRSPSKGWICQEGRADVVPASYAAHGAAAISVLTDQKYFGGSLDFLRTARPLVRVPLLRKEFIVDEYQLYQARMAGADAVLLIAAALTRGQCAALTSRAHELELEVLLEIHSADELGYVDCGPDMVGVNNRNLGTFHTDVANSFRLAAQLPRGFLLVSESGISQPATVRDLRQAGFRGFLIGETFMRQADPGLALDAFIREVVS